MSGISALRRRPYVLGSVTRRLSSLLGAIALLGTSAVWAQTPASLPSTAPLGQVDVRNQLYEQLYRDVEALERHGNILKTVVKLGGPTVVHIEAQRTETRTYGRERRVEEAGSGVIIEIAGKHYVLTNRHVIRDAALNDVSIGLSDARIIHPQQVWADRDTDVAVMSVDAPNLVAARIGESSKLEIGDFVLAVGSPFGLSHSVTYGIISAKGRRDLELGDGPGSVKYQDFIQTDAAINPGNSGGPLISLRGEVIGINTAIASNSGGNEGIGFSIPIDMAIGVARQLISNGSVVRAFLGVTLDSKFTAEMAERFGLPRRTGAHIIRITPGSPAERAQLRVGDVILNFKGIPIDDDSHLVNVISLTEVGTEVPVVVFRGGQMLTVRTTVGGYDQYLKPEIAKP